MPFGEGYPVGGAAAPDTGQRLGDSGGADWGSALVALGKIMANRKQQAIPAQNAFSGPGGSGAVGGSALQLFPRGRTVQAPGSLGAALRG